MRIFHQALLVLAAIALLAPIGSIAQTQNQDLPSAGTTPGSFFYGFERFFEGIGTTFTFGNNAKTQRFLNLAEERLAEAQTLAQQGKERSENAAENYSKQLQKALERTENAKTDTKARVAESTSRHFAVLEEVADRVPQQAQEAVQNALSVSKQGHISSLSALSENDPEQATDLGFQSIRERVNKARQEAEQGDSEGTASATRDVQQILSSVEQSSSSQANLALQSGEELNSVIQGLDETENLSQNVPEQARQQIKQAKSQAIQTQLNALRRGAEENPEQAAQTFVKAAEARANSAQEAANRGNAEKASEEAGEYQKYAEFGEELSQMAQGIRTGTTTVDQLVQKATTRHLKVLQDVQERVPQQAQQGLQRAIENSQRAQQNMPDIPAGPSQQGQNTTPDEPSQQGGQDTIPAGTREGEPIPRRDQQENEPGQTQSGETEQAPQQDQEVPADPDQESSQTEPSTQQQDSQPSQPNNQTGNSQQLNPEESDASAQTQENPGAGPGF